MNSLLAKVLLWAAAAILLSLAGFEFTARMLTPPRPERVDMIARTQALQLEGARRAYDAGGRKELDRYLRRLDSLFQAEHYLVGREGIDLVDGSDRSSSLRRVSGPSGRPPGPGPFPFGLRWPARTPPGPFVLASPPDGGPRLLILLDAPGRPPNFLPYYLWILFVVLALGYAFAVHLVRPLRRLRTVVQRFGEGDLASRTNSTRRDEVGDVSRAFDEMAGRIETLLSAERRLLQDVSHELRSPLARLGFAVELARTSPDRQAAADRIKRDVDRLSELVDGLLQLTRAEGDPSAKRWADVELFPLVHDLVDDCLFEAAAADVKIDLRGEGGMICGDRELIRRAVENVLRNAVRHSPSGSTVDVTVEGLEERSVVTVRDHGTGVAEEHLESIFEPFVRVGTDRSRSTGGVGLGLAIAKRAVTLHGGLISARNVSPGLAVTIDLPSRPCSSAVIAPSLDA